MLRNWIILPLLIISLNLTKSEAFTQIGAVRATVLSWSNAWERKDVDEYMSFYSRHFRSKNLNHDEWRTNKTLLFMNPCSISIKISDLSVFIEDRSAMANFIQHHHCGQYKDVGEKSLIFIHSKNGWKIVSEEWKPLDNVHRIYGAAGMQKARENKPLSIGKKTAIKASVPSIIGEKIINEEIKVQTGREMDRIVIDTTKYSLPDFSTANGKASEILIDIKNVSSWKGKAIIPVNGYLIKTIRTRFHRGLNKVTIILDLKPDEDYMINRIHYMDKKVMLIEVRKS